jgi:hypothetical protein
LGIAALPASSVMAKTQRHHHAAPSSVCIPSDARGAVDPRGAFRTPRDGAYESDSLGHQSFPNPDRTFPAPDHYY